MLDSLMKVLGLDPGDRALKRYRRKVEEINDLEPKVSSMTDEEILERAKVIRAEIVEDNSFVEDHLIEVFALAREVAKRKIGLRPFDVQLIGAMALHEANIAEMKTGEGKTLVAPIAVILNAFTGKGVHVVTVNDYLARRDSEWMAPLYEGMGVSVGVIYAFMDGADRKKAYDADVTYGTNSEFGFDYLRDNMVMHADDMVQRGHNFCIVDEVDSILIDEARTPLIISGPSDDDPEAYKKADAVAKQLEPAFRDPNEMRSRNFLDKEDIPEPDADFEVDEKDKTVAMTSRGIAKCESILGVPDLFTDLKHADMAHKINQALKARFLFKKDVHYVVKDGEIVIVDEFTGRLMFGRRFSEGLHQAIEAKEGVKVGRESQTLATITIQNYFRMYDKLSGMTGTAATEAEEFKEIYGLGVIVIPTNMPVIRKDEPDSIYKTVVEKFNAVADEIERVHKEGRPLLIGTASVDSSEKLSRLLKARKVPHQVLNARYHEKESQIVAQAGRFGAVTVATNMAGRGTDIVLGGNPDFLTKQKISDMKLDPVTDKDKIEKISAEMRATCAAEKEKVLELGGLCILGTERHEARRIDNQLRGRAGRQGDPGTTRFYLSLEDDLLRLFGSDRIQGLMEKLGMKEGESIEHSLLTRAIEGAQKKVELMHYDIRRQLLMFDNVMNQQREAIYEERSTILMDPDVIERARSLVASVVDDILDEAFPEGEPADPDKAVIGLKATFWPGLERYLVGVDDRHHVTKASEDITAEVMEKFDQRVSQLSPDMAQGLFKFLSVHVLDGAWKEQLLGMDALRHGIGLRAIGQKDPLLEYQSEAYILFKGAMANVREKIAELFFKISVVDGAQSQGHGDINYSGVNSAAPSKEASYAPHMKGRDFAPLGQSASSDVGRNDPCPCGSGKKYKACCGKE